MDGARRSGSGGRSVRRGIGSWRMWRRFGGESGSTTSGVPFSVICHMFSQLVYWHQMAAPIFTQHEADHLITVKKNAILDAWSEKTTDRQNSIESAVLEGESDEATPVPVRVIFHRKLDVGSTNITLEAMLPGRPMAALCRYDIHDSPHLNKKQWMRPPDLIPPSAPHRHIYSERSEREIGVWDARAELLDPKRCSSRERLLGAFLSDMRFHFTDNESQQELFEWINQ